MSIGKLREVSIITATEPVTLAEAKNYLRVTNTQDDAKITSQISAARAIAEAYLSRDILPRQREQFILQDETQDGIIELYNTPIDTSVSITVTVSGDTYTAFDSIGPADDPFIKMNQLGSREVAITYSTNGLTSNETVRQGVLAILGELYEYGEVQNKWVWTILKPLKRVRV